MPLRRLKWSAMLLAGSLFLLGRELEATTVYSESKADLYLQCGASQMCSTWELWTGDFDGDGFDDVVSPESLGNDFVVFGKDFPPGGSVPSLRTTRITHVFTGLPSTSGIGDITGDGKEDIFHVRGDAPKICYVTLGRPNPTAIISPPADLTIDRTADISPIAFGDVNGDGIKDVLFYTGTAYVVFGSTSFNTFTSTISVSDPVHVMTILGGGIGTIASGDVDGDGYDDILLGDTKRPIGGGSGTEPGVVYVIRGSSSLPSVWDLRTRFADWTIVGEGVSSLDVSFAADFTGDGKADIGLNYPPVLVNGTDILSKGPICTLTPGLANSLTPTSFPVIAGRNVGIWLLPGDFDGDGRPDLCVLGNLSASGKELSLILSHSFPAGSTLPDVFPPYSIQFTNAGEEAVLGDLNGDGKSDLIYQSETYPLVNVFYGHYPLENPRIVVQAREPNQLRAHLTLSVDGEPTEMRISGDIADAFKDQWISYKTSLDVTLTSTEDDKHVQAQFRNAFKRESALVQESLSLAVGTQHVTVRTNRVKEGGRATLDCSLTQAGRIKAAVFNRLGEKVLDLMDEEHGPGVWPVEWDGRNSEGNPVVPGFYILTVDISGQETKTTVLVQK